MSQIKKTYTKTNKKNNGMIVNEKKLQALILGKTEHNFCFPVNNSIDIFGMTLDNRLSFVRHVSVICKKININQFIQNYRTTALHMTFH